MKKPRLYRAIRGLPVALAAAATAFALHACGRAEAEPQADPQAVQVYLSQMEAAQAAAPKAEKKQKKSSGAKFEKLVEGAANRAPSETMLNSLEDVVVAKLAG